MLFEISLYQFTLNWGADVVKFCAQNVSFSMLVASNLAPWGTIERFRGIAWGSRLGFLSIRGDFGTAIWEFLANFGTQIVFFGMRVCRSRFL